MKRNEKIVLTGTLLVMVLIVVVDAIVPGDPDWSKNYSAYQRSPFGCALVHERLEDLFDGGSSIVRTPIYETAEERLMDAERTPVNHIFIEQWSFQPDSLDLARLLQMVSEGDHALIASEWIHQGLLDTLGISTRTHEQDLALDDLGEMAEAVNAEGFTLHMTDGPLQHEAPVHFARGVHDERIDGIDTAGTVVIAADSSAHAVMAHVPFGDGAFVICTTPLIFTNYYLLRDSTARFMAAALSSLPDAPVLWDEYYKVGRIGSTSPMRFILSQPALKWAYWTAVVLLLLTIFAHARRRQRAVPVWPPLTNTSRQFADTVGRLYHHRGDHLDMARKMGHYFKDEVAHRLFLRQPTWDEPGIRQLSERTGISAEEWRHALRLIAHYETTPHAGEQELLRLDRTLSRIRQKI